MSATTLEVTTSELTVSATAYWIAHCRAVESERDDALFHDPYAAQLAGPLGATWPARMPSWPIVCRIKLIDELIARAVHEGAECVLNLAAGLDTRPYRMSLPPALHWIEADLPAMVEYKERTLAGAQPTCQLKREKVDLTDAVARSAFLERALAGRSNVLVITEGLLQYLSPQLVAALGCTLAARPELSWWITELTSPGALRIAKRATDRSLEERARMRFAPDNGVGFFRPLGWTPLEIHSLLREAAKHRRLPAFMRMLAFLPEPRPDALGDRPWGGVIRFGRTTSA